MKKVAIIIDAHQISRSLDASQSRPKSLDIIKNNAVIDWTLHALTVNNFSEIIYIGGYHIEKILEKYPNIKHRYHVNRLKEGELKALCLFSPQEHDEIVILRGSTLILPHLFEKISSNDHMIGYYETQGIQKFSGFLKVGKSLIDRFFTIVEQFATKNVKATFEQLIEHLKEEKLDVNRVMIDGMAAPVGDQLAIAKTVFQGKGRTLQHLSPLIQEGIILDQLRFSVFDWRENKEKIFSNIQNTYPDDTVIVRSCATSEDRTDCSSAGLYDSVLNVETKKIGEVESAIHKVIESYGKNERTALDIDEILIQKQITNLIASGVLLTRDPTSGAAYYVLSIDKTSGRSDSVTGGLGHSIENYYISRNRDNHPDVFIAKILKLSRELISLSHLDALDIEFGISETGEIYLFQVRPLVLKENPQSLLDEDLFDAQREMRNFVASYMQSTETLNGKTSVLSVMSDWNPAEMIGKKPKPLALSLYQTLIGQNNWAEARSTMGYKDISSHPLILSVGGVPYVDVRTSLNSLLPANTSQDFSEKWINTCINKLIKRKSLHDKIEFDLTMTCLTPDWKWRLIELREEGFQESEIIEFKNLLRELTAKAINSSSDVFNSLRGKFEKLSNRTLIEDSINSKSVYDYARIIHYIIANVGKWGIIPFAIFARHAFISISFLRGMLKEGVIDNDDYAAFLEAIPTPASHFIRDKHLYKLGNISLEEMIRKYGHLRPNSYEITAQNYASDPNQFFYCNQIKIEKEHQNPETIMMQKESSIQKVLNELGLQVDAKILIKYMIDSIQGREFAKFEFMKDIDLLLGNIALFGKCLGLSNTDLSYLTLDEILKFSDASSMKACEKNMLRTISFNKKKWSLTNSLQLPDIICDPVDIEIFKVENWQANYVTNKTVFATPIWLEENAPPYDLEGKIVVIRAADPGYDWIFAHKIVGLITEYGGIASHMAIRAAEFGLPAAIGCGSKLLNSLRGLQKIELDCANGMIRAI